MGSRSYFTTPHSPFPTPHSPSSISDSRDNPRQEFAELFAQALSHLHHLCVINGAGLYAGGGVGDERNAERRHPHLLCDDRFWHCGHADRVRPEGAHHSYLGGGFVVRPLQGQVDAFAQVEADFGRGVFGYPTVLARIDFGHVRETFTEPHVMFAAQRADHHQVDVIADELEVALLELRVDGAGGVGQREFLQSQRPERANRQRDLFHRVTFVVMKPSLHHRDVDRRRGEFSHNQPPRMSLDSRTLEIRNIFVRNDDLVFQRFGERPEARSEHDGHINVSRDSFTNVPRGSLRAVENRTGHSRPPRKSTTKKRRARSFFLFFLRPLRFLVVDFHFPFTPSHTVFPRPSAASSGRS